MDATQHPLGPKGKSTFSTEKQHAVSKTSDRTTKKHLYDPKSVNLGDLVQLVLIFETQMLPIKAMANSEQDELVARGALVGLKSSICKLRKEVNVLCDYYNVTNV